MRDEIIFRLIVFIDFSVKVCLDKRRLAGNNIRQNIVYLHRLDRDRYISRAEFVIDFYLCFASNDHSTDLYDAVFFLVAGCFGIEKNVNSHIVLTSLAGTSNNPEHS